MFLFLKEVCRRQKVISDFPASRNKVYFVDVKYGMLKSCSSLSHTVIYIGNTSVQEMKSLVLICTCCQMVHVHCTVTGAIKSQTLRRKKKAGV